MIRTRPLALCLLAGILLAGCGGSSTGRLTRSQLAAKVNGYCSAYKKAADAIPQPADFLSNAVAAAAYLDKLRPLVHTEFNSITALTPPREVESDWRVLVADARHQLMLFDSANAKAHAKDASGIRDLRAAATYKQTVLDPLQSKLGFTACLQ